MKPEGSTVTAQEAAEILNVRYNAVLKLIAEGSLPAARIGRGYVMTYHDVMMFAVKVIEHQTRQRMHGMPIGQHLPAPPPRRTRRKGRPGW